MAQLGGLLGENIGGIIGGGFFSLIGPEAIPAGLFIGTIAGGFVGQLSDGKSASEIDLGGLLADGTVRAVGGFVGLGASISDGLTVGAAKLITGATGGVALNGLKVLQNEQNQNTPNSIVNSDFNALNQQNNTQTPNQIVANDFNALEQQNNTQTPNQIVANDFNALEQQNNTQTPNQVVANDFNALEQQNNTQTPNQIVANDFNALEQQNNTQTPNQVVANDFNALEQQNNTQTPNQIVADDFNALNATETAPNQGFNTQTGTGETFGNDIGDGALQNLQNLSPSVLNANAQAPEGDVPAESTPATSSGDGAQPTGDISQTAPTAASVDPSVNNSFADAVQQAANSIDSVNQSVADNLLGDNNGSGNFGSGNGNFGSGDGNPGSGNGSPGSGIFGSGSFGSGGFSGGSGGGSPIVLDVATQLHQADHGIKITPVSSSNTFFNMTGSGRQNLTAWAGAGNGVLFFDPTGQGQLTQEKQIIFTAWDPGATSDMQALEDVFDTNHDGSLDAADADFSDFFVMVTNPDGTKTAYSLAQLGITSINLNANATNIALPDGSSINGETTFTTSTGATGTAATVTFAFDPNGKIVQEITTVNADGSTTIANVALNTDGSAAYSRILNTSADGLSKTLTNLNSGGVVTTIQTDDTVVNADGSTTETLTNYAGGTI